MNFWPLQCRNSPYSERNRDMRHGTFKNSRKAGGTYRYSRYRTGTNLPYLLNFETSTLLLLIGGVVYMARFGIESRRLYP